MTRMAKKRTNEDIETNDVFYEGFDIDEKGVLTRYTGGGAKVTVPDVVKVIGPGVFRGFGGLGTVTRITLPEGVKEIGEYAFSESDIEKITLPSSLKYIGKGAFSGCRKLKSITIPEGVRRIYEQAFEDSGLEKLELPKSLGSIGTRAFAGCSRLKKITFPEANHLRIDTDAFLGCRGLLDENGFVIIHNRIVCYEPDLEDSPLYVTIPEYVASVEDKVFSRYPVVHLTMSLNCPSWEVYGGEIRDMESIITNDGCSISFTDAEGKIAAKIILAIEGEYEWRQEGVIAFVRPRSSIRGYDFDAYDRSFLTVEQPRNKTVIALVRLMYPYELSEDWKDKFVSFLQGNILDVFNLIFEAKLTILGMEDIEILKVLEEKRILEEEMIGDLIEYAHLYSRNDFVMEMLDYQNKEFKEKDAYASLQLTDTDTDEE